MRKIIVICFTALFASKGLCQNYYVDGVNYQPKMEVAVTEGNYSGNVVIPEFVSINGTNYMVTEIGDYALRGCKEVTSITLTFRIKRIGQYSLAGCSYKEITIPHGVKEIDSYAFSNVALEKIIVDSNNPYFTAVDGVLYDKDVTQLYQYPAKKSESSFVVPEGVVKLNNGSFMETTLTSLDLPSTIKNVGSWNFGTAPNLNSLIIRATEVPYCGNNFTGRIERECVLYVPEESINLYKNDSKWGAFQNIRGLSEISSVQQVRAESTGNPTQIVNLQGVRLNELKEGINIVVYDNGSSKKVLKR